MRTSGLQRHTRVTSSPQVDYIGLGSGIWSDKSESKPFQFQLPLSPPASNGTNIHLSQPSSRTVGAAIAPSPNPWAPAPTPWSAPLPTQNINTSQPSNQLGSALSAPFVPQHQMQHQQQQSQHQQQSFLNGGQRRLPSENLTVGRSHQSYPQRSQHYDPFGYDIPTPLTETLLQGNGMLGRAPPQHAVPEQLPSPSGLSSYGLIQNQIESKFYNAPNVGPSPAQLRRDRILQPQYPPISSTSNIWSNTG